MVRRASLELYATALRFEAAGLSPYISISMARRCELATYCTVHLENELARPHDGTTQSQKSRSPDCKSHWTLTCDTASC